MTAQCVVGSDLMFLIDILFSLRVCSSETRWGGLMLLLWGSRFLQL